MNDSCLNSLAQSLNDSNEQLKRLKLNDGNGNNTTNNHNHQSIGYNKMSFDMIRNLVSETVNKHLNESNMNTIKKTMYWEDNNENIERGIKNNFEFSPLIQLNEHNGSDISVYKLKFTAIKVNLSDKANNSAVKTKNNTDFQIQTNIEDKDSINEFYIICKPAPPHSSQPVLINFCLSYPIHPTSCYVISEREEDDANNHDEDETRILTLFTNSPELSEDRTCLVLKESGLELKCSYDNQKKQVLISCRRNIVNIDKANVSIGKWQWTCCLSKDQ